MHRLRIIQSFGVLAVGVVAVFVLSGAPDVMGGDMHHKGHQWHGINDAVAVLHATQGNNTSGVVRFKQVGDHVKVEAHIEGLTPNIHHAIHIHQFGDCSSGDGKSAGGHYNPENHQHGLPGAADRHAGDLGNLESDAQGVAHYELTVNNITIAGPMNPILGRGVIVHAQADDGGQPTGNAGGRIACGVIGIAKSAAPTTAPATQPSR